MKDGVSTNLAKYNFLLEILIQDAIDMLANEIDMLQSHQYKYLSLR